MYWYLMVVFSGLTAAQVCPKGWSNFETSCYKFPNVRATWGTALAICKELKSNLVEIETAPENQYLEAQNHDGHDYWTGGNDIEVEGEWRWITSKDRFNFTDWDRTNPNNLQPNNLGRGEDCLFIYHLGYRWHDAHCNEQHFFICEKIASILPPTTAPPEIMETTTEMVEPTSYVPPLILG